jgi:hypothetical protein
MVADRLGASVVKLPVSICVVKDEHDRLAVAQHVSRREHSGVSAIGERPLYRLVVWSLREGHKREFGKDVRATPNI